MSNTRSSASCLVDNAHLCFTSPMDQEQLAAQMALSATVEACARSGLTAAWRSLVQDIYAVNLDRHEPDELGDTVMSFGIQCYENLKTRATRRFQRDDREVVETHWGIDGLSVSIPSNVLTFSLGDSRVVTMKVPFPEGRKPSWDRSGDWEQHSQARLEIAAENSEVLQYRTPAIGASPLFSQPGPPGSVQNYMLLWAGERDAALTAGWLAVPILGETPFIAREMLWWDDEPHTRVAMSTAPDRGPSFDQRPGLTPAVTLKKQHQEGQA